MTDTKRINGVIGAEVGDDWIKLNFENHDITIDKLNIYNQPRASLITTIESLQTENKQYETTVTHQQEAFKDQGKEILQYRRELESKNKEIRALKEESLKTMEFHKHNINLQKKEIESLKAITELAVKGLEMYANEGGKRAKRTLSEIEKLSNPLR